MTTGTECAPRGRLRLYEQTRCLLDSVASKPRLMLSRLLGRFHRDTAGTILPTFALAMIPVMTAVGAAVDYSRANNVRSKLQMALDSALLTGAKSGSSNWVQLATGTFDANLSGKAKAGVTINTSFAKDTDQIFTGTASATVPTAFLGMIKIPSLQVSVRGTATATEADNSCILTLDHGQPPSHISLTLNGAPIINLSGCSIRSNTALDCNGHDGNVTKSIASGMAIGCGNPKSYQPPVPDIYAPIASHITTHCGATKGSGVTWTPGTLPSGAAFKTITNASGRTEYHVCGDLTLTGSGALTGVPTSDMLIVIENGKLYVDDKASISTSRTGIVLTGNNSYPSNVEFPQGNGKTGSLTLSPPLDADNPWQGIALYQDPKLTNGVDNKWGPGADFNADGLVYLGKSNVVTDGNTSSSNAKCSKFVMNQFTTNGKVSLDFNQSVATCQAIGLKQWGGIVVHLVK